MAHTKKTKEHSCPNCKDMAVQDQKWRAESDVRTLKEAHEIRNDSARMKKAMVVVTDERKALKDIKNL